MKEEAIVHTANISSIGQRVNFQILLPKDARRIVGFEYGAIKTSGVMGLTFINIDPFRIMPNKRIGRLTLQAPGMEGFFYQQDLIEDRNIGWGEVVAADQLSPAIYSHGRKSEEVSISVEGKTRFIEGYYVDSWGQNEYLSLTYTLHLYLWVEKRIL